jgi:hypothetical protein
MYTLKNYKEILSLCLKTTLEIQKNFVANDINEVKKE